LSGLSWVCVDVQTGIVRVEQPLDLGELARLLGPTLKIQLKVRCELRLYKTARTMVAGERAG